MTCPQDGVGTLGQVKRVPHSQRLLKLGLAVPPTHELYVVVVVETLTLEMFEDNTNTYTI